MPTYGTNRPAAASSKPSATKPLLFASVLKKGRGVGKLKEAPGFEPYNFHRGCHVNCEFKILVT